MSLLTCPECKKKISETVDICPNCGFKLSKEKIAEIKENDIKEKESNKSIRIGCFSLIVFSVLIYFLCSNQIKEKKTNTMTKDELRKEQIEKQFSAWDGSHLALTKLIKKTMNDPNSYEHVSTVYSDQGEYLIVKTVFRGKNAFGGTVTNWVKAKVTLNGTILEILEQGL